MRLTGAAALLAAGAVLVVLAGCATSSGDPVAAIADARVAGAYIPLYRGGLLRQAEAAATVIAPGIAVTNAHNENLLAGTPILGMPKDYDLLFFSTQRQAPPLFGTPSLGQRVIAYGQGKDRDLRIAHGVVRELPQTGGSYFVFEGNAGPGFSGGPVLDEADGRLIGIVYGYKDYRGKRMIYAYDIGRVRSLFAALARTLPVDVN